MSRADRQAKWRKNSGRKRVEAHLPADTAERLEALAKQREVSRAAVLAQLIDAAASAELPATALASSGDTNTADMFAEGLEAGSEPVESADPGDATAEAQTATHSGTETPKHKLRKAHGEAPDGSDAWAVYLGDSRVGIVYRNTNPNEQRARDVRWIAVCERDATRKRYRYRTRTQAVEMMLRVERPHERSN